MRLIVAQMLLLSAFMVSTAGAAVSGDEPCGPKCYKVGNSIVTITGNTWTSSSGDSGTWTPTLGGWRWSSPGTGQSGTASGPYGSDNHLSWMTDDGSAAGKMIPIDCP